jgi:glutamate dehydrogenase/leucine dehydrogenase
VIGTEASPVCADGDPSSMTALGVLEGRLHATGGNGSLRGVRVCIQGAGNVGAALARLLTAESAELLVSDTDARRADTVTQTVGARVTDPATAAIAECDVLAPCALGSVVNDRAPPELRCQIITGGANNVLAVPEHAAALEARGILYAPDFCVNAGGLIFLEERLHGRDNARAEHRARQVGERIATVIEHARRSGVPPTEAALTLARARLRPH